jgi:hypothetical protein
MEEYRIRLSHMQLLGKVRKLQPRENKKTRASVNTWTHAGSINNYLVNG